MPSKDLYYDPQDSMDKDVEKGDDRSFIDRTLHPDPNGPRIRDRIKDKLHIHHDDDEDHPNTIFHTQEQQTSLEKGLSSSEAKSRLEKYGQNVVAKDDETMAWKVFKMLIGQFTDFMIILLLVSASVSIAFGDYIEAGTLFLVVGTNVVIGFVQQWKAEKALQSLKSFNTPSSCVIRDGKSVTLKSAEIVPGDIITLEEGSQIPADVRFFDVVNLQVMEATLTGESTPVEKTSRTMTQDDANRNNDNSETKDAEHMSIADRRNIGYMSTLVIRGRGKGIVVTTGGDTEVGKISATLTKMQKKNKETNTALQKRISKLGMILVGISLVVAIAFIRQKLNNKPIDKEFVKLWIKVGVSLAVSVIPEGLVAVVTVTFALGVTRMAKRNAIVRKLSAVETLGSITVICADKTGTLTEGKMKAEEVYVSGKKYTVSGSGYNPTGEFKQDGNVLNAEGAPLPLKKILMIGALCNNSELEREEEEMTGKKGKYDAKKSQSRNVPASPHTENTPLLRKTTDMRKTADLRKTGDRNRGNNNDQWKGLGDPTEVALEVAARKLGFGKQFWIDKEALSFVSEVPFDSDRSRMTVVFKCEGENDEMMGDHRYLVVSKGASSALLERCTKMLNDKGEVVDRSTKMVEELEAYGEKMAEKGLRVLAMAYKTTDDIPSKKNPDVSDEDEKNEIHDLILVGLVGILDPPRQEVKYAIEACREAGIGMCMITGDHKTTAFGIAASLGIIEKHRKDLVLEGFEIDRMSTAEMAQLEPFPVVFARVSPENKLKIIKVLRRRGEVTAMTGDGVNDAPAIRFADAGISMGKTGTELTKESSDIILTDDNLNSIVPAIEEGRRTFDNIQKFIFYLLACNSAEIYVMLIAIIFDQPVPFTPVMILWANIILDIPPAMALGIDPPARDVLHRAPRDPKKGIFPTWRAYVTVLLHGLSMAGLSLGLFFFAEYYLHYGVERSPEKTDRAKSLAFIGLGMIQLIHSFVARQQRSFLWQGSFWRPVNWWLIGGVFGSMSLLIAANYIPSVKGILQQKSLSPMDWAWVAVAVVSHIVICELLKVILHYAFPEEKKEKVKETLHIQITYSK
ncbi:calcium-transporting P-type ATPase [Planoprotostelium fungivorum]|uniref:Calcium-transporting P-type ATPase n=1 Tax=Planoprotostelium fungivorum TaxID=1890364 RepID=A0A2P6N4U9_9EUKA|nr:calcium-transporting P-type ATPase [Planoprotostelium fungivorum]